jgi:AbiV family abortive infection protein
MAKIDHLKQYRGRLTPSEIATGMNAAARNARRLLSDAELLLSKERYPLAASIAILAIEEAGKISILRGLSTAPDDATVKESWRAYRSHQAKNVAWIIADLASKGATTLRDLKPIYDGNSDHPFLLDALKQIGFYTDCCGDRHWSEPHEIIDDAFARTIVMTASILCPKREISVREIELWVQHVAPEWGKPSMFLAAYRFHEAMEMEGLGHHDLEKVRRFLGLEH